MAVKIIIIIKEVKVMNYFPITDTSSTCVNRMNIFNITLLITNSLSSANYISHDSKKTMLSAKGVCQTIN